MNTINRMSKPFKILETEKYISYNDAFEYSQMSGNVLLLNEHIVCRRVSLLEYSLKKVQITPMRFRVQYTCPPIRTRNRIGGGYNRIVDEVVYPLVVGNWIISQDGVSGGSIAIRGYIDRRIKQTYQPNPYSKTNAIVLKNPSDEYLWVYNGKSWGFPKGYPAYKDILKVIDEYALGRRDDEIIEISCREPEEPHESVLRELKEETGISLSDVNFVQEIDSGYVFSADIDLTPKEHFEMLQDTPIDTEVKYILWSKICPGSLNPISKWAVEYFHIPNPNGS